MIPDSASFVIPNEVKNLLLAVNAAPSALHIVFN